MANVTVTFTITEFCLHTGISEEELNEIVGLGVVEPREIQETTWVFDDHAAIVVQRAVRLRHGQFQTGIVTYCPRGNPVFQLVHRRSERRFAFQQRKPFSHLRTGDLRQLFIVQLTGEQLR